MASLASWLGFQFFQGYQAEAAVTGMQSDARCGVESMPRQDLRAIIGFKTLTSSPHWGHCIFSKVHFLGRLFLILVK